jgi:tRNA pseudouridine13 synthase
MIRVGDFEYVKEPAKLGDLAGNRFGIILRAIDVDPSVIARACEAMQHSGFINYYGLQRFGKGGSRSHDIGRSLFRGEWKRAVDMLFSDGVSDVPAIVEAKAAYFAGDFRKALKLLPYQLHSERSVLEGLVSSPTDFCGAFNRIAKNPRLICAHAYQSYIWNMAASERINKFGLNVVEGDLVATGAAALATDDLDEDVLESSPEEPSAEAAVTPSATTSAATPAAAGGGGTGAGGDSDNIQRVGKHSKSDIHVVTAEDLAAGKFTIHDVILPLPGSDIVLPAHEIGKFYLDMLSNDGLSLEMFSKCYPQFRMSGAYRSVSELTSGRMTFLPYNSHRLSSTVHCGLHLTYFDAALYKAVNCAVVYY